jgi:hypothetical protein
MFKLTPISPIMMFTLLALLSCIRVDATELPLVADTFVRSDTPTQPYGGWGSCNVSANSTCLLQFSSRDALPSDLKADQLRHASLILYSEWLDTSGSVSISPMNGVVTDWTTFATMPSRGQTVATKALDGSQRYVAFDVTQAVAALLRQGSSDLSFGVHAATPTVAWQAGSKEGHKPARLVLTISPATSPAPTSPSILLANPNSWACTAVCYGPKFVSAADSDGAVCVGSDGKRYSFQYRVPAEYPRSEYFGCGGLNMTTQCVCRLVP